MNVTRLVDFIYSIIKNCRGTFNTDEQNTGGNRRATFLVH